MGFYSYKEQEAHREGLRDAEYGRSNYNYDRYSSSDVDKAYFEGVREQERHEEMYAEERRREEREERDAMENRQRQLQMEEDYYYQEMYEAEQERQQEMQDQRQMEQDMPCPDEHGLPF